MPRLLSPLPSALLAAALLLAACGDGGAASDPIALEGETDGDTAVDADAGAGADGAGADADGADADGVDAEEGTGAGEVDGTRAEPGTWRIGDAGTVTFSVSDGALSLDDVTPADGWEVTEEEVDDDEIDVDFERSGETYEFQVDLEDGGTVLKVDIDHDIDDADPGTFDLGDAGSITVSVDGGRLVLDDLTVGEGWEVATREEEDDEIEIDLVSGDRRWDVEFELDDGLLDVALDYEVRSSL